MDKKIEYSFKILDEIHQKIVLADLKANFLIGVGIALLIALLGVSSTISKYIEDLKSYNFAGGIVIAGFVLIALTSLIFVILSILSSIKAVNPRLTSLSKRSAINYFDSISSLSLTDYEKKIENLDEQVLLTDIVGQIHDNSQIASAKYQNIRWAVRHIITGLFFVISQSIFTVVLSIFFVK